MMLTMGALLSHVIIPCQRDLGAMLLVTYIASLCVLHALTSCDSRLNKA